MTITNSNLCPDCGAPNPAGADRCGRCALPLKTDKTETVRLLNIEINQLDSHRVDLYNRRVALIGEIRAAGSGAPTPAANSAAMPDWMIGAQSARTQPQAIPAYQPKPRAEWTPKRVQNFLLTIGGGLCVLAALLFAAYAWSWMGVGGKALTMVAVTLATGTAGYFANRRNLNATGETLTAIALVLALIDVGSAHAMNFASLGSVALGMYWATTLTVLLVLSVLYRSFVSFRALEIFAFVVGQVPLLCVLLQTDPSPIIWSAGIGTQILVLYSLHYTFKRSATVKYLAEFTIVAAFATWLVTAVAFFALAFNNLDNSGFSTYAIALGIVPIVSFLGWARSRGVGDRSGETTTSVATLTALALTAGAIECYFFDGDALAISAAALALVLSIAATFAPRRMRAPSAVIALAVLAIPVSAETPNIVAAVVGYVSWINRTWQTSVDINTQLPISPDSVEIRLWWAFALVVVSVPALCASLSTFVSRRVVVWVGLIGSVLALDVVPAATNMPYVFAVGTLFGFGALLSANAVLTKRLASYALGIRILGLAVIGQSLLWSLANETTTLAVLGASTVVAIGVAILDKPVRVAATVIGTAAVLVFEIAFTQSLSWSGPETGLALVILSAIVLAASEYSLFGKAQSMSVSLPSLAGAALGVLVCLEDAELVSWAVLAVAASAALIGMLPARRNSVWVAASMLVIFVWFRLGIAEVETVEAYTLPLATLLLAAGLIIPRKDETATSWIRYGFSLTVAFGPSMLLLFADDGSARPMLVGLAALIVLFAGAKTRLQAPLTISAIALVVDALIQVAPLAYDIPRWVAVGVVGVLLVGVGATYERRLRNLRTLRAAYDNLA